MLKFALNAIFAKKQSKKRPIKKENYEEPSSKQPGINVVFEQTLDDCVKLVTTY
jgi:hypothetical protein